MTEGTAVSTEVIQPGSVIAKEINALYQTVGGLNWGSVSGSSFSKHAQYEIARFCCVTKANPMIHVDMLGGRPYLNAEYYSDLCNNHPRFHHYEQWDISPSVEAKLREMGLEDEANRIALERMKWSPPEAATVVVQTTIYRFINQAPIDKIKAGEITGEVLEGFIVPISECNWAGHGGTGDPVGTKNPALTARTRSFRRCANKAFSAWMEPHEAEIKKAEHIIEAEYEIIREDASSAIAALPSPDGPQAVDMGQGEAVAANTEGAMELPVEGEAPETPEEKEAREAAAAEALQTPPTPDPEPPFNEKDARGRFFATLKAAGITGDARKEWCRERGLPDSTKEWGKAEYDSAQGMLVDPTKNEVLRKVEERGLDLGDLSLEVLKMERPDFLEHWQDLATHLAGDGEL